MKRSALAERVRKVRREIYQSAPISIRVERVRREISFREKGSDSRERTDL